MSTHKYVCPHCGGPLRIRSSKGEHQLLRTNYIECVLEACHWSALGRTEITHELSPSGMPNPNIKLPPAPSLLRRQCIASRQGNSNQMDMLEFLEA